MTKRIETGAQDFTGDDPEAINAEFREIQARRMAGLGMFTRSVATLRTENAALTPMNLATSPAEKLEFKLPREEGAA